MPDHTASDHNLSDLLAVRRELLQLALHNSSRSVPLQLVATAFVVALGVQAGRIAASVATALLALAVALSRLWILRNMRDATTLSAQGLRSATRALEGNAALSGAMWAVSTLGIYPALKEDPAATYLLVVCGSVTVAAFFMSLAGHAFAILATTQLGALALVYAMRDGLASIPVVLLLAVFGLTIVRAAAAFKQTAARAIEFSHRADRAMVDVVHAKETADAANLAKSQFLATMSHEIRTPMNGVLGSLDLLRHSTLTSQQRDWVLTAASSGESLMTILNDVLDHAKIEAGKLQLIIAPMSVSETAESAVRLFRANAAAKGIAVELDVAVDGADRVRGDAQRVRQVLLNLIGNAVKFTELGAVTLRISSKPLAAGQVAITFQVSDTGSGMPADVVDGLFQPFFQGQRNRRHGGTGLGLSISQRIVQAMGGEIEVRSRPGNGSTFRFVLALPLDESPEPPTKVESGFGALDDTLAFSGTALVVDDNPVNRIIAADLLKSLGLTVMQAEDGAQAVDMLVGHYADFVLMDCEMPVMDGYAATRKIRAREAQLGLPHMPILAVTANAFEEDVTRALAAGMDGHLPKPFTRSQLRAALAVCL